METLFALFWNDIILKYDLFLWFTLMKSPSVYIPCCKMHSKCCIQNVFSLYTYEIDLLVLEQDLPNGQRNQTGS